MTRIAIEATGCDKGFPAVLEGTRIAMREDPGLEPVLVAGKNKLPEKYRNLKKIETNYTNREICLELTENTFNPEVEEFQKNTSIQRAIEMHSSREVEAVVVPGGTKPAVIYSVRLLRKLPGVERPALAVPFLFDNVLVDAGVNEDCTSKYLLQFAVMGQVFSKHYLKVESPLIGLLSNGTESPKGNDLVKASRPLIERLGEKEYNISSRYFEPYDMKDRAGGKVFVVDGFTGNEVLKTGETFSELGAELLKEEIAKELWLNRVLIKLLLRKPYGRLKEKIDYQNYAAFPLLGINGKVMIAHGRSDERAIGNAIIATGKYLKRDINTFLARAIEDTYDLVA